MPQPGKLRGSARFGSPDSPCRKFFGPCSLNDKPKPDRPVIMQSDVSALEVRGLTKRFDRPAVDALDLDRSRRRVLRPARPQRRRQDHDLAHGRRPAQARRRHCLDLRHRCARRSRRRQADRGMGLRRADDLRQADAAGISRIRRRPLGHRSRGSGAVGAASFWCRSASSRICTNAARDSPRACARRWRWPARWFTIPG